MLFPTAGRLETTILPESSSQPFAGLSKPKLPSIAERWSRSGVRCAERGQGLPPFPARLSPLAASILRYAPDRSLLTKANTSCTIEMPASLRSDGVRVHSGMPFGFPPESAFGFAGILTHHTEFDKFVGLDLTCPNRSDDLAVFVFLEIGRSRPHMQTEAATPWCRSRRGFLMHENVELPSTVNVASHRQHEVHGHQARGGRAEVNLENTCGQAWSRTRPGDGQSRTRAAVGDQLRSLA
jgi:hypothetical protein